MNGHTVGADRVVLSQVMATLEYRFKVGEKKDPATAAIKMTRCFLLFGLKGYVVLPKPYQR